MLRFYKDALDCTTSRIHVGQPSSNAGHAFSAACRAYLHGAEMMIDPATLVQEHPLRIRPRNCPLLGIVAADGRMCSRHIDPKQLRGVRASRRRRTTTTLLVAGVARCPST
jgi:hypothetical protein